MSSLLSGPKRPNPVDAASRPLGMSQTLTPDEYNARKGDPSRPICDVCLVTASQRLGGRQGRRSGPRCIHLRPDDKTLAWASVLSTDLSISCLVRRGSTVRLRQRAPAKAPHTGAFSFGWVPICYLVKAIVDIAQGLGQQTIAEGVENSGTLDLLREYGVDLAQGFHLGRPQPLEFA